MQPPTGSAPITLTATRHKSTGSTSFQVESDFSQARMLASWGSSDYTVAASGDKYLITAAGKVYTFAPGSVGLGVPLPTVVAEFEVTMFDNTPRPSSVVGESYFVVNFVPIVFGSSYDFGTPAEDCTSLTIYAPSDSAPDDPYSAVLWVDWFGQERDQPIAVATKSECVNSSMPYESIPASAIWSFGNLMSYPSVPTIG